jgi:hypothetical protein
MSKIESTAVNELIDLVQNNKPMPADPSEDLMFAPPKARMTAPLPATSAVPPLPRTRSPSGTQQDLPSAPAVRTSTAPPSRGTTIPPLPRPPTQTMMGTGKAVPPPRPSAQRPAVDPNNMTMRGFNAPPPLHTTASRPALPPPMRPSPRPEGTPAPEVVAKAAGTPAPQVLARSVTTPTPAQMPIAAPFEPRPPIVADRPPVAAPAVEDSWFEPSRAMDKVEPDKFDETFGTMHLQRRKNTGALLKKLIAPTVGLVILGVCVGGYFAFDGEGGKKRAAVPAATEAKVEAKTEPTQAEPTKAEPAAKPETKTEDLAKAEPAPAEPVKPEPAAAAKPEPAVAKTEPVKPEPAAAVAPPEPPKAEPAVAKTDTTTIKTTRGEVKLVDVRIDSSPSGATVMLVDRGKTSFLGTTPVNAAVDPSRAYDLVFTAANHATQVEHLDPNTTHHYAVTLGTPGNTAVAAPAPAPAHHDAAPAVAVAAPAHHEAPAPVHHHHDAPAVAAAVAPKNAPAPHVAPKNAPAPKADGGNGTLMVSSKPPCEIVIDGKPTGLTTPQRAIPLPPGVHKVTFINAGESINKTVSVSIAASKSTKLLQDLMKK